MSRENEDLTMDPSAEESPVTSVSASQAAQLAVQLEDLFHCVWSAEAGWRRDDRIDLAARLS